MSIIKSINYSWNFFISLENSLEDISRYIEFSERNNQTYSIELARLFLTACSEVDGIAKQLCNILEPERKSENITCYQKIIVSKWVNFPKEKVYIERYGLEYQPWITWSHSKTPSWWNSYNRVKHKRHLFFEEANLINTIESLAALLILLFYYYGIQIVRDEPRAQIDQVMSKLSPNADLMHLESAYYPKSLGFEPGHLLSEVMGPR